MQTSPGFWKDACNIYIRESTTSIKLFILTLYVVSMHSSCSSVNLTLVKPWAKMQYWSKFSEILPVRNKVKIKNNPFWIQEGFFFKTC